MQTNKVFLVVVLNYLNNLVNELFYFSIIRFKLKKCKFFELKYFEASCAQNENSSL